MDITRCDDCCDKLDGIDDGVVFLLSEEAQELTGYEHLCEECMDNYNSDEKQLVIFKEKYSAIIRKV